MHYQALGYRTEEFQKTLAMIHIKHMMLCSLLHIVFQDISLTKNSPRRSQLSGHRFIIGDDFNIKHNHCGSRLTPPKREKIDGISDSAKMRVAFNWQVNILMETKHWNELGSSSHSAILSSTLFKKENAARLSNTLSGW